MTLTAIRTALFNFQLSDLNNILQLLGKVQASCHISSSREQYLLLRNTLKQEGLFGLLDTLG